MLKKSFALLLLLCLLLTLAACGTADDTPETDTSSDVATEQDETDTKKDVWGEYVFDEKVEHKFLATDIKNHSIVIFDLSKCKGDPKKLTERTCVVWEWDSDSDPKCKIKPGAGIDAAKLRYSEYYKKDVVIACSSSGWAGVVDYKKKSLLWEYNIGNGPHSIEMMPNGDVVVAGSGGKGILAYVPLSAGVTKPSHQVESYAAHGVSWDPQNNCLWVLESSVIVCFEVENAGTADAKLVRRDDKSITLMRKDSNGHVLSPVVGKPGYYWITGTGGLWMFNSADGTVTNEFENRAALTQKDIKGFASFADGTSVQTAAGLGGKTSYTWSSKAIRVMIPKEKEDGTVRPVNVDVVFQNREFYKVFPLMKDYQ